MLFVFRFGLWANACQTPSLVDIVADTKGGDAAVFHLYQAVGAIDDLLVMGGENKGGFQATVDLLHQAENFSTCCLVKIRGGFIGEDDAWLDCQGAGDGDPLSLSPAELIRAVIGKFGKTDNFKKIIDALFSFFCGDVIASKQRIFDVFSSGKNRQQIECLKNEANRMGTEVSQFIRGFFRDVFFVDKYLAAARLVDAPDQVEQGGLAASGWAGNGEKDAGLNGPCNIIQCLDGLLAKLVILEDMFYSDNAHDGLLPSKFKSGYCGRIFMFMLQNNAVRYGNGIVTLVSGIFLLLQSLTVAAQATSVAPNDDALARSIVEKADKVRFPSDAFQVDIVINSLRPEKDADTRKYRVLSKGNENTVVMVTEPASERGQIILMKGRDLWVFMPEVSQPVRISLAQRLTGQVANGDLARANFSGDYNPKIISTEKIGNDSYHVLELIAVDRSVTYQRVVYWVNEKSGWPLKAEFYSLSNRLMKKCSYENFKTLAGRVRPTRLVMEDALKNGEKSILDYSEMKLRDLPDKVFTKEYLKKLD